VIIKVFSNVAYSGYGKYLLQINKQL